jgi:hypothetical protein
MKKSIYFDVLIVYNEKFSSSSSNNAIENKTPFSDKFDNESYNIVYGHFLEVCEKFKLKVAFTTSADIVGMGLCKSFWSYKNKKWSKNNSLCSSKLIFDKFAPTNKGIASRRDLLFSSKKIKPFNEAGLFNLFFDKQETYNELSKYSIPTISLEENNLESINNACSALAELTSQHPHAKDFSSDIVMKDEFGAGGENVYKFKSKQFKEILAITLKNSKVSFIIQPFVKFDQGFSYHNAPATTDIRFVYLSGKIVQSYIRIAKNGDFRCNEHLGGALTYLPLEEIPQKLVAKANIISKILNDKSSLYALDFVISNNGNVYLLEGNSMPGLDWNMSLKDNEIKAKKLIELVVKEMIKRTKTKVTHRLIKPIKKIKFDKIISSIEELKAPVRPLIFS